MENTHLDPAAQSGTACPQEQEQTIVVETTVTETPQLSRNEIVERLRQIVDAPINEVKDEVEALKQNYYKVKRAEVEIAYKAHIESGKPESEFVPQHDELEEPLKELLASFKERKAQYLQALEKEREENLARKNNLLNELKSIIDAPDEVGKQYQRVQQIQQEFKSITDVPAQAVTDLWKTYQNYTEQFYDLLKINKELRDYDFKKNLEQKEALCKSAEQLTEVEDVISAFKQLQILHNEWREIGPVAKELREDIWNRFKEASTVINKRHQTYFESRKETETQNETAKTALCEEIEQIIASLNDIDSYTAWDEKTQVILSMQERWKSIGFASRKNNTILFERFRQSCDAFFAAKAEYFKRAKENLNANLDKKRALCEKAEALKDSTDWKATTDALVAMQKEWKQIGPVAKKHSDIVWKRFNEACDYFFEQKKKAMSSNRETENANLAAKQQVIDTLKAIDENLDDETARAQMKEAVAQWNSIGHVPFREKDKLYKEYKKILDVLYNRFNSNRNRSRIANFSNSIQQLGEGNTDKLYREREKLARSYELKKNEIQTYENNKGFLSLSSSRAESLVHELDRKIKKLHDDMELIAQKIELIDQKLQ
ncbi:MAG: DUF349 domain-containing protein [Bacteroidaceae bacterium]|nr:DUF349 domain-containing protein [Bacteroidaceae bacterium]